MPRLLTPSQNSRIMHQRISQGGLDQYFDEIATDDIKELSVALNEGDIDKVAEILVINLNVNGTGLADFLGASYDSEIEAIASRFIEDYINKLEIRLLQLFEQGDIEDIDDINDEIDFEFPHGFRRRMGNIRSQIREAKRRLLVPSKIRKKIQELADKKKIQITPDLKARLEKWKDGRVILSIRDLKTGRFRTYRKVQEGEFDLRKRVEPKIEYHPQKEIKSRTVQEYREDRKGKPLTFKEKAFIDSRSRKSPEEIYDDYVSKFGNVRTKTELVKEVRGRR